MKGETISKLGSKKNNVYLFCCEIKGKLLMKLLCNREKLYNSPLPAFFLLLPYPHHHV
jgi:hypothetical protein